ncbi:MAG: hypothetical protein ACRBEQ_05525 [Hyphomonas sp.]
MWFRAICLAAVTAPILGACATTPKACTAEWIDYKADSILKPFAVKNRGLINELRKLQSADGEINPIMTIRLMSDPKRLERFADSFTNSVIPELEAAFEECSSSGELVPALTDFLRDEGVSEESLEWVGTIVDIAQNLRDNKS